MAIIILLFMLFFHMLNDCFKQKLIFAGHLFQIRSNEIEDKYNQIVGLIETAFLWTFTVMFPITWILLSATVTSTVLYLYISCFASNWGLHFIVDYFGLKILPKDPLLCLQYIRIIQIILTWMIMILYCGL